MDANLNKSLIQKTRETFRLLGVVEDALQRVRECPTREEVKEVLAGLSEFIELQERVTRLEEQMRVYHELHPKLRAGLREIGYNEREVEECMEDVPDLTLADIEYAKSILESYDTERTDLTEAFFGDTRLVVMPKIDTSKVERIYQTWGKCRNLKYVPLLDFSSVKFAKYIFSYSEIDSLNGKDSVKLKRIQPFDFSAIEGNGLRFAFYCNQEVTKLGRIRIGAKCTDIGGIFGRLIKLKSFDGIEFEDFGNIRAARHSFEFWYNYPKLPVVDLGNIVDADGMFRMREVCDLSEETIRSGCASEVNLSSMFSWSWDASTNLGMTGAPKLEIKNPGSMSYMYVGCGGLRVIPDYCHLAPTSLERFYAAQYGEGTRKYSEKLERIEGLNFERVTSTEGIFSYFGKSRSTYSPYPILNPDLRYIRIVNLGKSACAVYDLVGASSWGDGSEENLQSLVDSLLTNSYDRQAAGMEPATIRLDSTTANRLTDVQKAAITSKGYSITTIDV
ncbi:MAG: hypothetical protein K2I18_08590 [Paramuribaculum sp.]|nr:hypothetical protein [Paramuribaculum sp.]